MPPLSPSFDKSTRSWTPAWARGALALVAVIALLGALNSGAPASAAKKECWSSAGSNAVPRWLHTATMLKNGEVLVAGGFESTAGTTATAEIYEPGRNRWRSTGSMNEARWGAGAALLPNGTVLVAGGIGKASAEIYDPKSETWSYTGSMNTPRTGILTPLKDGRVLAAGGYNYEGGLHSLSEAEIYDWRTGTWTSIDPMSVPRDELTATVLRDGRVLVAGGIEGSTTWKTAEILDPATGTWTQAASMAQPRNGHTATLLNHSRVLVIGGWASPNTAEIYDPNTDTWSQAAPPTTQRTGHIAEATKNGADVLVAGGAGNLAQAEMFTRREEFVAVEPMAVGRYFPTATTLHDGSVLVVGGVNLSGAIESTAERFKAAGCR